MKDLNYWKENATENYMTTPISVLRYITELENKIEEAINYSQCCETLKGGKEHNIDVAHNGYCTKCRCREIKRV